jgi:hypothetical protein
MGKNIVLAAAVSKNQQMKAFVAAHRGDTFTASGLAKVLGWSKRVTEKGETRVSHNAKAAVRLAKKHGANVEHQKPVNGIGAGRFQIEI